LIQAKVFFLPADLRSVPRLVFINEWSGGPVTNFGSKPAKKVSSKTLQTPEPSYPQNNEFHYINIIKLLCVF
jgi:hypothetical protein